MDGAHGSIPAQNLRRVELANAAPPDAPHNLAHMHIFVRETPLLNRSAWVNFGIRIARSGVASANS
jgi:hypothetical protein